MSYLELAKKSLEEIRSRPGPATSNGCSSGERTEISPLDPDQFAAMTVSDFAQAGMVVKIHSDVLGCEVLFVSDDVPESEIPDLGLAVYRAAEMRKLALWRPASAELRRIHAVKEVFGVYGATITDIESRRDQDDRIQERSAKKVKEAKKASGGGTYFA